MPFQIDPGAETDAEVVDAIPAEQIRTPSSRQILDRGIEDMRIQANGPDPRVDLYEKRARAVTLFIRIPLLTFISLNSKVPGMIRLGAGALALWDAFELSRSTGELEDTVTEWAGQ